MAKMIALCGVCTEFIHVLKSYGGYRLLCFGDELERRGDVKLAYFLRGGPTVDFAIVGYPGAVGLSACDYLRTQNSTLPILWVCDQKEFETEARRLGVNFYGTSLPDAEYLATMLMSATIETDLESAKEY